MPTQTKDHPFRRPVSERALAGETLRPTMLPPPTIAEGAKAAGPSPTVRVLSINYCPKEGDDITTLIMELSLQSMHKVYELFKFVNVIHLNITEMTREECANLLPAPDSFAHLSP
jgi:hypothetical protein